MNVLPLLLFAGAILLTFETCILILTIETQIWKRRISIVLRALVYGLVAEQILLRCLI